MTAKAAKVASRVERIVKAQFSVTWFKPSPEDKLRLLRLGQWEEKYKVPLEWIMGLLIPIWREKFSKYRKTNGLGVTIATLVGGTSEEILKREIKKEWPDGQNIAQWKAKEQELQWAAYRAGIRSREDWEHPIKAARDYQQRMMREREKRKKFQRLARRRPYRDNPWTGT